MWLLLLSMPKVELGFQRYSPCSPVSVSWNVRGVWSVLTVGYISTECTVAYAWEQECSKALRHRTCVLCQMPEHHCHCEIPLAVKIMNNYYMMMMYAVTLWLRHYATIRSREFSTRWRHWISPIYHILSAAIGPVVYLASNSDKCRKLKNNVSREWNVAGAWGWRPQRCEPIV
jgi:hypothetical protein